MGTYSPESKSSAAETVPTLQTSHAASIFKRHQRGLVADTTPYPGSSIISSFDIYQPYFAKMLTNKNIGMLRILNLR